MKISRPPSPITRAAARAPRNAPVRLTSRISRQTDGSVLRGPATIGEIPALQIHTSTPPHSATVASATASLKSSSVTSPASTSDGPGSSSATALRSASVRATSATRAPLCENAHASKRPRPRLAPVITTRFPVTSPTPRRTRGCRSDRTSRSLVCTGQYNTPLHVQRRRPPRDASADARDPRVRGARGRAVPRRRDSRASCTCRSGRRRRPSARAGRSARPT